MTANYNNNCGTGSDAKYTVAVSPGGASYQGIPGSTTMSTGSFQLGAANSIACTVGSNTVTVTVWASTGSPGSSSTTVTCGSVSASRSGFSLTGLTVGRELFGGGARAACLDALNEKRRQCETATGGKEGAANPFGFSSSQCAGGKISEEIFVNSCLERKGGDSQRSTDNKQGLCKVVAQKALRLAHGFSKDESECRALVDGRCRYSELRERKQREFNNPEKVRQIAERYATKLCTDISIIAPRYNDLVDLSKSKTVSVVASVPEERGPACEAKLAEAGAKVSGFQSITAGGTKVRVYYAEVSTDSLKKVRERTVGCAEDVAVNYVQMALQRPVETKSYADLGGVVVALKAVSDTVGDSEAKNLLEGHQGEIAHAAAVENRIAGSDAVDKGPAYSVLNVFGVNEGREKEESKQLSDALAQAKDTADRLEKLAASLQDSDPTVAAQLLKIAEESRGRVGLLEGVSHERYDAKDGYYVYTMRKIGLPV